MAEIGDAPESQVGDSTGNGKKSADLASVQSGDAPEVHTAVPIPESPRPGRTFVSWNGPLPPPEALAKFNEVVPNGADRIFALAEKQSDSRQYCDRRIADSVHLQESTSRLGVIFGFVIVMTGLLMGGLFVVAGKPLAGFAISGLPLAIAVVAIATRKAPRIFNVGGNDEEEEEDDKPADK